MLITKKNFEKAIKVLRDAFDENQQAQKLLTELWDLSEDIEFLPTGGLQNQPQFPIPQEMKECSEGLALFSDGACRGNPGPGAWAGFAQNLAGEVLFKLEGVEVSTTNNKMELEAAVCCLEETLSYLSENKLDDTIPVYLFSDSKYVVNGAQKWMQGWKEKGWKKADKKAPENIELWKRMDSAVDSISNPLHFIWVKGHSGHPQNEYCDQEANRLLDESGF
ncbi:MAG: ribonuclease H family protein [Bacteriovoracaceae bacterium]